MIFIFIFFQEEREDLNDSNVRTSRPEQKVNNLYTLNQKKKKKSFFLPDSANESLPPVVFELHPEFNTKMIWWQSIEVIFMPKVFNKLLLSPKINHKESYNEEKRICYNYLTS